MKKTIIVAILSLFSFVGCVKNQDFAIIYTTSNGDKIHIEDDYGIILSHTFDDGVGKIKLKSDVDILPQDLFWFTSTLTSVIIPSGITCIGQYTFSESKSLASITIPDSVTEIGYRAFYGCSSLAKITIPDSVTKIGDFAFYGCI